MKKVLDANIKIDVSRTIGEIDPKIHGVFMEPISFRGRRFGLPGSVRFQIRVSVKN